MTNFVKHDDEKKQNTFYIPFLLLFVTLPLSMILWSINLTVNVVKTDTGEPVHPMRWFLSVNVPVVFAVWGKKRKSVNQSGAILGFLCAFILTLSNYAFLACLIVFFVTSSLATKFKSKQKAKVEVDFKEGGQRNWIQVLCNGGMATVLAAFYLLDPGCGQNPINLVKNYRSSWLSLGVLGAFACANGDTWASEFGTVLSKTDPVLITSFKKVPKGVNGGISLIGLFVSGLGGLLVGIGYFITICLTANGLSITESPVQWPTIVIAGLAGLVGSMIDSILGAIFQFSGVDTKTGIITEVPGPNVKRICGRRILDNHSVNLLSTIIMAFITPKFANLFW